MYPTQDTSRMGTPRVKQEDRNMEEMIAGTNKKIPKRALTRAKDLTIELPEER